MATEQQYIGYDNIISISNVTADSEATGYPITNLANPATNIRWKSDSTATQYVTITTVSAEVDYIGIAGHNFGSTAISVEVQAQQNDGDDYETIVDAWTPDDDKPIMKLLTGSDEQITTEDDGYITGSITASYDAGLITDAVTSYDDLGDISIRWFRMRLKLTPRDTAPRISVLYTGKSMPLERGIYVGHTPITLGREVSAVNGMAESGDFLGRIIRRTTFKSSIRMRHLTPVWYRNKFDPFVQACKTKPFFYAWRLNSYADEIGYCWFSGGVPVPENTGPRGMMSVSFDIGGQA